MRRKLALPALAVALLSLTACDLEEFGDFGKYSRDFHYSHPLQANGKLNIESFNGSIEISGWDQNTVDISGTKYGPTQAAADDLKVDVQALPDSVTVRVIRPSVRRNNQGARFVIKIPRNALLDRITTSNGAIRTSDGAGPARLRTSNGQVNVSSLAGSVDVQTSNASVDLMNVDGDAIVRTSNGSIRSDGVKGTLEASTSNSRVVANIVTPDRPVRVETSNGSIELTLPGRFSRDIRAGTTNSGITVRMPSASNAHVVAHTSNSSIHSEFDVNVRGEIGKNHMDATIGSGGPLIDLNTSNGGIRLLRM